jgi:hypothetical protein
MSFVSAVGSKYKGHIPNSSIEGAFFVFTRNHTFYLNCIVPPTVDSRKEIDSNGNN